MIVALDAAVDEAQLHFVALELAQAFGDRFERTIDVGLDDEVERRRLAHLDLLEDVLELGATGHGVRLTTDGRDPLPVLANRRHLRRRLLVRGHDEAVTCGGRFGQAEDLDGHRRPGLLDLLTLVVDDHCIRAMMSAAVVVEGNRAVFTVMETLTLVIDDLDGLVVMSMVGSDDYVSFGCRSYRRHRDEQGQSAHDHCFHFNISIC